MAAEDLHGDSLIAIVGAGRVAQALGRALAERGTPVVALAARDPERARRAAAFIAPSVQVTGLGSIARTAPHLLIAVSDDAIEPVATVLAENAAAGSVALHTSGSRGPGALAPLQRRGVACGVLHPLQSIPSPEVAARTFEGIAFGVSGDEPSVLLAERLARLAGGHPLRIAPGAFAAYHAGAVMAGNQLTALLDAALVLFGQAGVPRRDALDALAPLCRTTLANVLATGPDAALTGPVARGDVSTIAAHLAALDAAPEGIADLYVAASRRLIEIARRQGLDADAATAVESVLHR